MTKKCQKVTFWSKSAKKVIYIRVFGPFLGLFGQKIKGAFPEASDRGRGIKGRNSPGSLPSFAAKEEEPLTPHWPTPILHNSEINALILPSWWPKMRVGQWGTLLLLLL